MGDDRQEVAGRPLAPSTGPSAPGIRAEWTTYAGASAGSAAAQLSDISEQWVAEKDLPEMGFTLGGLDELRDPAVRLMLAIDERRPDRGRHQLAADATATADVVGWTLDFMRRRPGSINGVMEFLIAEAATRMREDGIEFMSLSAAPLAHTATAHGEADRSGDGPRPRLPERLARAGLRVPLAARRSSGSSSRSMHPLIMAYPDPVALPAIGVALVRAYLPGISVRQAAGLARGRG